MRHKILASRLVPSLEKSHVETDQKLDELHSALQHIRYEGKLAYGKNVRQIKSVAAFLKDKLIKHIQCEEKLLFPFLKRFVPKVESVVDLLMLEHQEFRKQIASLADLSSKIGRSKSALDNNRVIEKLHQIGYSLIFMLRHHIHVERQSIYKAIKQDLKVSEKKYLTHELQKISTRS